MDKALKQKKLTVTRDMTLEVDMHKHPALDFAITVAAGRQLNLVWLGSHLSVPVRPTLRVELRDKARLHLAVAVAQSPEASVSANITLAGTGSEAYVSAIFHGTKADRHTFSVAMHHQAKSTKGDILIKGVYEDASYGKFSGLLKIHPGADQTNSYFADNVLLFSRGMATSIPTLEILANDVRATHGSTTSRVNAEQLFYLQSRGLAVRQAVRHIIQGFFHPVRVRLPQPAVKFFPQTL